MSNRPGVAPVPTGRTARRLEWQFLPTHVRTLIAERCGSPVVSAVSQGGGFTPGFASVLTCEDGTKHFVKAASVKAQRIFAESYREESRKLGSAPGGDAGAAAAVGARVRLGGARHRVRRARGAAAGPGPPPTSTPPWTRSRPSPRS